MAVPVEMCDRLLGRRVVGTKQPQAGEGPVVSGAQPACIIP